MAKKPTLQYECSECGWTTSKWIGQCRQCSAWGTLEEKTPVVAAPARSAVSQPLTPRSAAAPISQVSADVARYRSTGVSSSTASLVAALFPAQSYPCRRAWGW